MAEAEYERVTYGITMAPAETLSRVNPRMTFVYISGAVCGGVHVPSRHHSAAARNSIENPFLSGFYSITKPVLPFMRAMFSNHVLTHGTDRARDAGGGAPRISEARARDPRYWALAASEYQNRL
jgi:hypothetical protein